MSERKWYVCMGAKIIVFLQETILTEFVLPISLGSGKLRVGVMDRIPLVSPQI